MENFEEKLEKLEQLARDIKRSDIPLEQALKDFEEGIKLARGMEEEIDKIEGKIQKLMNQSGTDTEDKPQFELFNAENGEPVQGTRQ